MSGASLVFRIALGVSLGASTLTAQADIAMLGAGQDNTLYEDEFGSTSNGMGESIFAGVTGANAIRRGLIAFDIAGTIPVDSVINSVTLELYMSQGGANAFDINLHRVSQDWGEGASDAEGEEGQGAQAEPGDATWLHTFYDGSFWDKVGGDFSAASSATANIGGIGWYSWSSADMTTDVQSWLDAPAGDFGWALIGDETMPGTSRRFASKDNLDAVIRPQLIIDYTPVPAPGVSLLVIAGMLSSRTRRRSYCG